MKRYLERCLMVSLLLAVLLVLPAGAATKLFVPQGGTGATTLTGLLQGNGTSALTGITNSSTVGQALRVTDASTYAWGALDLADGDAITGALPFGNGGTGLASWTQYLIPYAATTTSIGQIAIGTDGQVLTSAGAGVAPAFEDAAAGGQTLYEAVVAASGGDYTTVGAAITAGATRIFVRNGTYAESAITTATNNIEIIGESQRGAIISMAGNDATFSGNNVIIENLSVNLAAGVLTLSGVTPVLRGTYITKSDAANAILIVSGEDAQIESNYFDDNSTATTPVKYQFTGARALITNNKFDVRTSVTGTSGVIRLGALNQSFNSNTVIRKTSSGTGYALYVSGSVVQVASNNFKSVNTEGLAIVTTGTYVSVVGNFIHNFTRAIQFQSATSNITGNFFDDINGSVITTAAGVNNNVFSGNSFEYLTGVTRWGIDFVGQNLNNIVVGNYFFPNGSATEIRLSSTSQNNVIAYNRIESGQITDTGQGNTFINPGVGNPVGDKVSAYMKNTSGGALAVGDLVTFKAVAAGDEVTTTTTQGNDLVFGMAEETIADTAYGNFQILGKTTKLKVDGTTDIAIGDFIGTFTTAKIGMKAAVGDMAIAIALEAYVTDDSNGVIDALLITPRKF